MVSRRAAAVPVRSPSTIRACGVGDPEAEHHRSVDRGSSWRRPRLRASSLCVADARALAPAVHARMTERGMLRGHDILCFSSIDWQFIWQGHQEIMSTLAANGNRVLFVENTGVRAPAMRDLPRVRQRVRNWWRGTKGFRRESDNLFIYSPILLPFPYSPKIGRAS